MKYERQVERSATPPRKRRTSTTEMRRYGGILGASKGIGDRGTSSSSEKSGGRIGRRERSFELGTVAIFTTLDFGVLCRTDAGGTSTMPKQLHSRLKLTGTQSSGPKRYTTSRYTPLAIRYIASDDLNSYKS